MKKSMLTCKPDIGVWYGIAVKVTGVIFKLVDSALERKTMIRPGILCDQAHITATFC